MQFADSHTAQISRCANFQIARNMQLLVRSFICIDPLCCRCFYFLIFLFALCQALTSILSKTLSPSLAAMYGGVVVSKLALARAGLYTAMAATSATISHQSILRYVCNTII